MRISITNAQKVLPINRPLLRKALMHVASAEGWRGDLSVAVVDDATMQSVNDRFSGRAEPTDVLAFFYGQGTPGPAGEIVVSAETAQRVAPSFDETPERELLRYLIHGLLHLCGYQDRKAKERRRMENLQERYLCELSCDNRTGKRESGSS